MPARCDAVLRIVRWTKYLLLRHDRPMLKILGKASSINVRKVLWTCAELGLPFEREDWGNGFRPTDAPEFVALNPNAMVPVVVDGGFVLWESNTICRYLCAQHGGDALLPTAPRRRAMVEQWMDWQATELNNAWRYAFMALVRHSAAHADAAEIQASAANWNRQLAILDRHLDATGAFAAGDSFTLADIVLGLSINRWMLTPMHRPEYPAVALYYQRLHVRPGFAENCGNGIP
jgi:glutathione S-transferase